MSFTYRKHHPSSSSPEFFLAITNFANAMRREKPRYPSRSPYRLSWAFTSSSSYISVVGSVKLNSCALHKAVTLKWKLTSFHLRGKVVSLADKEIYRTRNLVQLEETSLPFKSERSRLPPLYLLLKLFLPSFLAHSPPFPMRMQCYSGTSTTVRKGGMCAWAKTWAS